jgi:hypothetical protein
MKIKIALLLTFTTTLAFGQYSVNHLSAHSPEMYVTGQINHAVIPGNDVFVGNAMKSGRDVISHWDTIITYVQDTLPVSKYIRACDYRGKPVEEVTLNRNSGFEWVNGGRMLYTYDAYGWVETVIYQIGNPNGGWDNSSREIYTHTPDGKQLTKLDEVWYGLSWHNSYRTSSAYSEAGLVLSTLHEKWNYNVWKQEYSHTYTYDFDGRLIIFRSYGADTVSNGKRYQYAYDSVGNNVQQLAEVLNQGVWENSEKYTFTYNASNLMLTEMKELWSGGWNNYYRYTYTYNNQGQKITATNEIWFSTEWRNTTRWIYNYDGNDHCILIHIDIWENEEWHPYSKEEYEYDAFLRLKRNSSSMYSENDWLYQSMYTYDYDDYSNLTSRSLFTWNDNQWMNCERWIFTYDSLGNSLTGAHNSWTETGWEITEGILDVYENGVWATAMAYCSNYLAHFGNLYTKTEDPVTGFASIVSIYPNPVREQFTVNLPLGSMAEFQYRIYDANGRLMLSDYNISQNSVVDVRMLPPGMYLLNISNGTNTSSCRFIRQ